MRFLALGNPPPKPQKCLLGTSQTLIRKEARYHDGKQETEYTDEILGDGGRKTAHRREDDSAPNKEVWGVPAEDGD